MTVIRIARFVTVLTLLVSPPAHADPPKVAVFDFELVDTSLQGEVGGPRDSHTGELITSMSADLRGNTDESWSRAMAFLVRNRLLAPNYGAPQ